MHIINFAHPLTPEQLAEIESLVGEKITEVTEAPSQIDPDKPIEPQIQVILDGTGLTAEEWQAKPLLINLPSLNYSAAALLAQLHGRAGYFPPVLRLRPVKDALPVRFEVAEILNLQAMRERAREKRR